MKIDPKSYPILIVDDDSDLLATLRFNFQEDFSLFEAASGSEALETIARERIAVLVADQRMPEMSGAELISQALERRPEIVPIVLTGYTDYPALVRAVNTGGVFRYVQKPFDSDELRQILMGAIEVAHLRREQERLLRELEVANERLEAENLFLKRSDEAEAGLEAIIGKSAAMDEVRRLVLRVLDTSSTVLLAGPTGTGKELIARAIHQAGPRRNRLFVPVNCGAVTETLLESELFGHRKGAFTGAITDAKGLFQLADGGTIFLDEIGEASQAFQVHLLRVLEDRRVRPVGDTKWIPVDVRVIAATNRDLQEEVRQGRFREDLLFRLKVYPVRLPSLAERREDILDLARHFLAKHAQVLKRRLPKMSAEAEADLESRELRGNVRELSNLMERALLLTDDSEPIEVEHLYDGLLRVASVGGSRSNGLKAAVDRLVKSMILQALEKNGGNRKLAAENLGVSYRWLLKLMRKYGLSDDDDPEESGGQPAA